MLITISFGLDLFFPRSFYWHWFICSPAKRWNYMLLYQSILRSVFNLSLYAFK